MRRKIRTNKAGGGPLFVPKQLSGNVFWVHSGAGITTVDATVTDINNLQGAAWSPTRCTATAADTMTDQVDGAPATHILSQAVGSFQTGHAFTASMEFKAGTLGWAFLSMGGGTNQAYINLTTGALGTIGAGTTATSTSMGDGWWKLTISGVAANNFFNIFTANADNGISYQGDGTGTIRARNAVIEQRNVSAWADQSGTGNHALQATAAFQPLYLPSGGIKNLPFVAFDGSNDYLRASFALAQPVTLYAVLKPRTSQVFPETYLDGVVGNDMRFLDNTTDTLMFAGVGFDPAITSAGTGWHWFECVYNGASSTLTRDDGVTDTGNAGAASPNGVTLGAFGSVAAGWSDVDMTEIIIYNRTLTAAEKTAVQSYLIRKYM